MMDMHCHLDLYKNPHQIVAKCKEQGLYVLSVTTTPKAWSGTNALTRGYDRIRTALGLHPQLAHERDNELELFKTLLPDSKYVEQAHYLVVVSEYRLAEKSIITKQKDRYTEVIEHYKEFIDRYPDSQYLKDAEKIYSESVDRLSQFKETKNVNS